MNEIETLTRSNQKNPMANAFTSRSGAKIAGVIVAVAGVVSMILAPLIGGDVFSSLWGVEPLSYIGAILVMAGLLVVTLSYYLASSSSEVGIEASDGMANAQAWSEMTRQYFALFHHDLGRPMTRILEKERELRAVLGASGEPTDPAVAALLEEIERQTPNFRLMLSNIQVLIQLEAPSEVVDLQPVELSEVIRRIVDRYVAVATEAQKEITWWAEPSEFGIVYADSSAIEHIATNLIDNAVKMASEHVEVTLAKNPTHFFIRVWDDGPGIAAQYIPHIFERGWTPAVAKRDEKTSSGLGLFIVRTMANRIGGDITVESVAESDTDRHTTFLVSLPLGAPDVPQP